MPGDGHVASCDRHIYRQSSNPITVGDFECYDRLEEAYYQADAFAPISGIFYSGKLLQFI